MQPDGIDIGISHAFGLEFRGARKLGQRATRRFLDRHFNDIGRRSTIDIADKIAAELAET